MPAKFLLTNPIFHNSAAARKALEALRWPQGPVCTRCDPSADKRVVVLKVDGERKYRCKACRTQFTVTVGTVFHRTRVPLHKWMLALHLLSSNRHRVVNVLEIADAISVSYKTALGMWKNVCTAILQSQYRGFKQGFGTKIRDVMTLTQPQEVWRNNAAYRKRKNWLVKQGRHPSQNTITATGLLASYATADAPHENHERLEVLLRLLLTVKAVKLKPETPDDWGSLRADLRNRAAKGGRKRVPERSKWEERQLPASFVSFTAGRTRQAVINALKRRGLL